MLDSDDEGDFTESSIFDLDSAPAPPDGHHSPTVRRWKQPTASLTNALPARSRAFSAPSIRVSSSNTPSPRQVAFATSRDSEEPLEPTNNAAPDDEELGRRKFEDTDNNEQSSSSYCENDESVDVEFKEGSSESDEDFNFSRETGTLAEGDDEEDTTTTTRHSRSLDNGDEQVSPSNKNNIELMEEELSQGDEPVRTRRGSSHDVSSSRWSDSEFHSTGESGEETPSSTRSLPWGHNFPDCCSSEFISWNRTCY